MNNKPLFSVHEYDSDGDIITDGVFFHFGDTRIHVAENMEQLQELIDHLLALKSEIETEMPRFI